MKTTILRGLKQIGLIAIICFIGVILEWSFHDLFNNFSIKPDYVPFAIIFGPIWAFIVYKIFRKYFKKYLTFAVVVSFNEAFLLDSSLQAKHYFEGFDPMITMLFMVLHFLMYMAPAYMIFKHFRSTFELEN